MAAIVIVALLCVAALALYAGPLQEQPLMLYLVAGRGCHVPLAGSEQSGDLDPAWPPLETHRCGTGYVAYQTGYREWTASFYDSQCRLIGRYHAEAGLSSGLVTDRCRSGIWYGPPVFCIAGKGEAKPPCTPSTWLSLVEVPPGPPVTAP